MDKTEKFIREELSSDTDTPQLDVDAVIAGTHINIKKRASRRKAIYSSPIAILLVMLGIALFPDNDELSNSPGGELFMVGWEYSWTDNQDLDLEADQENELYEQTVDYLIDDNYFTYSEDVEAFLDDDDIEALKGFLKEA